MPADRSYWGYDFEEEDWAQARSGGLAGAVRGMQGTDTWWDTLGGMASGFRGGMEKSLAGSMEMDRQQAIDEEKQRRELEAEAMRQRELEAAQAQIEWAREQLPDDLEAGMIPDAGFASPTDQAEYLGEQTEAFRASQTKTASNETVRAALLEHGIKPTGDPEIDRKVLESAVKPESPMTEYQRRSLAIREQQAARADAEDREAEEEEQAELDADWASTNVHRTAVGLPRTRSQEEIEQEREAKEKAFSKSRLIAILGDDYTGIPAVDNAAARDILKERRESGESSAPPPVTSPTVNKPAAPGMPHSARPKPTASLPTNGPASRVVVSPNEASLTDKAIENILGPANLPPARMQSFLSSGLNAAFKQQWAAAKDSKEREMLAANLVARLRALQGLPPA